MTEAPKQLDLQVMISEAASNWEHLWIVRMDMALKNADIDKASSEGFAISPENLIGLEVACARCGLTFRKGRSKSMCRGRVGPSTNGRRPK